MAINTWTVVNFEKDDSVEAVPTIWLDTHGTDTMCYWPRMNGEALIQAMKKCLHPQESWDLFKCRPFKHGTFDNYMYARQKARKAERTSDLSSTDTGIKRKIKPVIRSSSSSSLSSNDEQDILPAPSIMKYSKRLKFMDNMNSSAEKTSSKTVVSQKMLHSSFESQRSVCSFVESKSTPVFSTLSGATAADMQEDVTPDVSFTTSTNNRVQSETSCSCCYHQTQIIGLEIFISTDIQCIAMYLFSQTAYIKLLGNKPIERGTLTQLLADIEEIKKKLGDTNGNNTVTDEDESIFQKLELPLSDVGAMDQIENYLEDKDAMKKAQIEVSRIGGNNPGDFIRRAMPRIVDDLVCKEYNWEGKKGKKQFKVLRTAQLLLGALAISQGVKGEYEGSQFIKNFIKNAAERVKQRQNRM